MNIGIVGAGTMGAGIAQVFAAAGHTVLLCDLDMDLAARGKAAIGKNLARQVSKGKLDSERSEQILAAIRPGLVEQAGDCALIIEAVREDLATKQDLFRRLASICPRETIFASNTSSLSITAIGKGLDQPMIGMHFFNPPAVMELVEVITGLSTPPQTVRTVVELARQIGKKPVLVQEAPGFVVNRILIPMINEAIVVLAEGTATAEDIDNAMKWGANHPIGPLALADLIGLDVVLAILETLQQETGDSKYRPSPLLRKMVRGGQLGRKSGTGFFSYL